MASAEESPVTKTGVVASDNKPVTIESARATELIGHEVRTAKDDRIAKIDDFLIDVENGRILQVLVSGDSVGEGRVEVPPRTFGYSTKSRNVEWRGDVGTLSGAPRFKAPGSNRPAQAVHATEVYRYYGEEPYFIVGEEAPQQPNNVHTHGKADLSPARVPMGRVILASELLGLDVKDAMDNKVGDVDDLIIDLPAGRVVALVITTGGFLGLGESLNAVPPATIRYIAEDKNELRVTVSKETLQKAPRYQAAEATRFNDSTYTDEIYRSYQVDPYSTVVGADNTRRNIRDRDNATLTPLDQSNASSDIEISARIRKDIVAREDFSVTAKNVKIITRDGVVTLRGPVKTLGEKRVIEVIATREAGSAARVDNQLEVVAN